MISTDLHKWIKDDYRDILYLEKAPVALSPDR
jgi:hypothetical protein